MPNPFRESFRFLVGLAVGVIPLTAPHTLIAQQARPKTSRPPPPRSLPRETVKTVPLGPDRARLDADTPAGQLVNRMRRGLRYQRWLIRVEPQPESPDGIFWNIVADPLEPNYKTDFPGKDFDYEAYADEIPVLRIPGHLWNQWVDPELRNVVGIHFHDLQSFDAATVLFTRYNHPPQPITNQDTTKRQGTRIEGSLLLPLSWWLDQTILVRSDEKRAQLEKRLDHEKGHAANAMRDLLDTIAGPQTWNEKERSGRKSNLVWRFRYEKLARPWDSVFGGKRPVLTLRTYIDVLPPTRWSLLTDKPADDVDEHLIKAFNDSIILIDQRYRANRAASAKKFHKRFGGYEKDDIPNFRHITNRPPGPPR